MNWAAAGGILDAVVLIMAFCWMWMAVPRNRIKTIRLPLESDPYFLAWMSGMRERVKQVALLSLVDRQRLDHAGGVKFYRMPAADVPEHPLEAAMLQEVDGTIPMGELFERPAVLRQMEDLATRCNRSLSQAGLLQAELVPLAFRVRLIALALLFAGAGAACYLGADVVNVALATGIAALLVILCTRVRPALLNAAGTAWLELLRKQHVLLQHDKYPKDQDLLRAAALFGWTALREGAYSLMIQDVFVPPPAAGMSLARAGRSTWQPPPIASPASSPQPWTLVWLLALLTFGGRPWWLRWWD